VSGGCRCDCPRPAGQPTRSQRARTGEKWSNERRTEILWFWLPLYTWSSPVATLSIEFSSWVRVCTREGATAWRLRLRDALSEEEQWERKKTGGSVSEEREGILRWTETHDEGPSPYPYSAQVSDHQDVTAKKSNHRRCGASDSTCLSCPFNHVILTRTVHSEQRKGLDQLFIFTSRVLILGPGQRCLQGW
jgi:hypothetical protein